MERSAIRGNSRIPLRFIRATTSAQPPVSGLVVVVPLCVGQGERSEALVLPLTLTPVEQAEHRSKLGGLTRSTVRAKGNGGQRFSLTSISLRVAQRPSLRGAQGTPRVLCEGRSDRGAFLLGTFLCASKEKYRARGARTAS